MEILENETRTSAVILLENIEEDLNIYPNSREETDLIIQMWKEEYIEKFFKTNPNVDDVLLFKFDGVKRTLQWIMSKETLYDKWIDESCDHTKSKRKWLDECMEIDRRSQSKLVK